MRSVRADHVPPSGSANGASTDVSANSHIAEEEPASNETLGSAAGRLIHDVQIGRVKAEGSSRETISYQIDPQKLNGNQSFGQTEGSSQENTDNLEPTLFSKQSFKKFDL